MIERWIAGDERSDHMRRLALVMLHGIFKRAMKVWGLPLNPAVNVEKPPIPRSGDIQVFSPEEVWALCESRGAEVGGDRGSAIGCPQRRWVALEGSSAV